MIEEKEPILEPHGGGFLSIGGGASSNAMGFRPVATGICPRCETPAGPWKPPIEDFRYMARVQALKVINALATDQEAHALHLKQQGGFIENCANCSTSFWVPGAVAKVEE